MFWYDFAIVYDRNVNVNINHKIRLRHTQRK